MRKTRTIVALIYLVLLVASHLYRAATPHPRTSQPDEKRIQVAEFSNTTTTKRTDRKITIAYRDLGSSDAPAIVFAHGSPMASGCFNKLVPLLEPHFRLILPDFPGFGGSEPEVADYAFLAHSHYTLALLDTLGIERAHWVAYSMGGGAAIHAADIAPERMQSLTLLSSIGVQEHELLGDYTLNHALHALQLGGIWLLQEGIPHFGWMDNALLNTNYARNFFESDQRPLRRILETLTAPALIIHGKSDRLVPLSAAEEHLRILPQSQSAITPGGHLLVFKHPEIIAQHLTKFLHRVESDSAPHRADATPERIRQASHPARAPRLDDSTASLLFVIVLLALATFVSEDLTCLSAGLLVAKGMLGFIPATVACLIGIFVSDLWLFFMGRWLGTRAIAMRPFCWFLPKRRIETGREWFENHGTKLIFTTRFIPGTRLPTYFGAGVARVRLRPFLFAFFSAAALWTPLLIGLSMLIGGPLLRWFERYEGLALWGLVAIAILFWVFVRLIAPAFTWKGRRLLLSRWRRFVRWEFWPQWAFYPPVAVSIIWTAIRHRSLTVFTAANPGIPCGGLVMESKREILHHLKPSGNVARFSTVTSPDELDTWMHTQNLSYPVVLKPDIGERGQGVAIVRSAQEAITFLKTCPSPTIAQEYIGGQEYGVFYARDPNTDQSEILSITEKQLITVTGDGIHTLEELILTDDRSVCMAAFFLEYHAASLHTVPLDGEKIKLTDLGTHCRGALFLDANHLITPALTTEIDRISRCFKGFYFGRYDLRAPSIEDFKNGHNLRILELNGVTSEPTHIYDPSHSLRYAYQTLAATWRRCFAIGAANVTRGAEPAQWSEIRERIRRFRNEERFDAPNTKIRINA